MHTLVLIGVCVCVSVFVSVFVRICDWVPCFAPYNVLYGVYVLDILLMQQNGRITREVAERAIKNAIQIKTGTHELCATERDRIFHRGSGDPASLRCGKPAPELQPDATIKERTQHNTHLCIQFIK